METEFQNATGKSVGEIARDVGEFLALACPVPVKGQELDLARLLPDRNMAEQFSYAFLMELRTQGWEEDDAVKLYRRAVCPNIPSEVGARMVAAFRDPDGADWKALDILYGFRFGISDESYWGACLAVAIDAGAIGVLMRYLRLFTVALTEVAYMEDRNPEKTYAWNYYETFRSIIDGLTAEPEEEPKQPVVRALGGSAGKREQDAYFLSLGVDVVNPNPDRMAWNVCIDVTLKDTDGQVITVIRDRIGCLDPGAVFHYGITKRIRGAAVSGFSATARAEHFSKLPAPIMKQVSLTDANIGRTATGVLLVGKLNSKYDRPLRSFVLHYQYLNAQNRILGGGNEWMTEPLEPGKPFPFRTEIAVPVKSAAKMVWSLDFDARELVTDAETE